MPQCNAHKKTLYKVQPRFTLEVTDARVGTGVMTARLSVIGACKSVSFSSRSILVKDNNVSDPQVKVGTQQKSKTAHNSITARVTEPRNAKGHEPENVNPGGTARKWRAPRVCLSFGPGPAQNVSSLSAIEGRGAVVVVVVGVVVVVVVVVVVWSRV